VAAELTREAIAGKWVHAHEEDRDGEMVFRPASHPLPPSRGRVLLELNADGTYVQHAPGPVDAPVASDGKWSLERDRLVVGDRTWEVASVEPERLVLRP
jgi:hypothetical protein